MKAIELAMFKLKPEVAEEAFRAALVETDRWLAGQPGFVLRRHGVSEAGRLDYVEWEDMAAAKSAAAHFMTAPETQAFMAAIDPTSIMMQHFELAA